jgi:hypothetical protein
MAFKKFKQNAFEFLFPSLGIIAKLIIQIIPVRLSIRFFLINFDKLNKIKSNQNNYYFRFNRYVLALIILRLDAKLLSRYFYNGAPYANLLLSAMDPTFKSSAKTRAEQQLIKRSQQILQKKFQPNLLLISCLYLFPYEFDTNLSLFADALGHVEVAPIYISFLFNTYLYYLSLADYEQHIAVLELAMLKMRVFLENSDMNMRERLANFLGYYVDGGVALAGYSNRCVYQSNKILLLLEYLRIKQKALFELPEYVPEFSSTKKRIGVIRLSLAKNSELEQVLSNIKNPPAEIELFLFVFDMNEHDLQQVVASQPWLAGKIIQLDLQDIAASLAIIRAQKIDFLVNTSPLSGKFINGITILFARRAAPMQGMLISDIVTSGIANMDYFIIPEAYWHSDLQKHFTETLLTTSGMNEILLQHCIAQIPQIKPNQSLSDEIVFGSNAHVMKLNPIVLHAWAQILQRVEYSKILLMPFPNESLQSYRRDLELSIAKVCAELKINPNRFEIITVAGREQVCEQLAACDIYLDTFPYNGSISIYDLLVIAKPMVTLKGEQYCNRLAATILQELKVGEGMIAHNVEEYVSLAVAQARDKSQREAISLRIRASIEQQQGNLFNSNMSSAGFYQAVLSQLR